MAEPLPRHPLSRYAARFSIAAPMAALLISCLASRALQQNYGTPLGWWLNAAVGTVMCLLFAAGLALGVIGLRGGRKSDSRETLVLATIGVTLNLGAVLVTLIAVWIVASRTP